MLIEVVANGLYQELDIILTIWLDTTETSRQQLGSTKVYYLGRKSCCGDILVEVMLEYSSYLGYSQARLR